MVLRAFTRAALLLALFSPGTLAHAQNRSPVTVVVRVVDSARVPVPAADVSIVSGLSKTLAAGVTDQGGLKTFRVAEREDELQVVARKLGFQRGSAFTRTEALDTVRVTLTLLRTARALDTIRVTADASAKRSRTFIDADAIAASSRPLVDAFDVLGKLRPSMTLEPPDFSGTCRSAQNIWVNGRRIILPPQNSMAEVLKRSGGANTLAMQLPLDVLSVLVTIKPEHIDAIEYHDCHETSVDRSGGTSALFVTLKGGVKYEPGLGSISMGDAAQDSLIRRITQVPATDPSHAYRRRVIGLYDFETGDPIAAADVLEVGTGTRIATSETGTASLAFMREGGGLLMFMKPGYRPDTLTVRLSPTDTVPVTVLLHQQP